MSLRGAKNSIPINPMIRTGNYRPPGFISLAEGKLGYDNVRIPWFGSYCLSRRNATSRAQDRWKSDMGSWIIGNTLDNNILSDFPGDTGILGDFSDTEVS